MNEDQIIRWLLEGEVSIQYQVHRDLFGVEKPDLQERIAKEGWSSQFLSRKQAYGGWGTKFYHPKWTSTNYTLLDLKNLNISPKNKEIRDSIKMVIQTNKGPDGGILPIGTIQKSDLCINGMFFNYACYFGAQEADLKSVVDLILGVHMPDGGFNCRVNRTGAVHSSMHTTINVLEGLLEYELSGYQYRLDDVRDAVSSAEEFLLMHRLFKSDKTGEVIDKKWLMLSYPPRWKYDILRALDYFQAAGVDYDPRMQDALDVLMKKQRKDSTWPVQAKHPGLTHFEMEKTGGPSRWNSLRALRVLKKYGDIN